MIMSILESMKIKMSFMKIICFVFALLLLPFSTEADDHKHTVSRWTITQEPTCTEPGTRYGVCDKCGKKVYRVIEAKGHSFGSWTERNAFVRMRTCADCGATELDYTFKTEKATELELVTSGTEQQIELRFPAGYADALTLILPAGEETELLLRLPGGAVEKRDIKEQSELTLPGRAHVKSLQLLIPARKTPRTLKLQLPEDAAESLILSLPALAGAAELSVPFPEKTSMHVTVTGPDAGKTSVKKAVPEISARLISSDVIEIEYPEPVLSDAEAKELFRVSVGGAAAEWEYLSYFDFDADGERGGVLSLRLSKALDGGQPAMYADETCISPSTQAENGPAAASAVRVTFGEQTVEASFVPFWSALRYVEETGATVWIAAGAEHATLPPEEAGLTVHLLGSSRSVYEDPDCRGRYIYGKTRDTFSRASFPGGEGEPTVIRGS